MLDCGAAPGSWLQVASKRVGPKGIVVGIDLQPITHRFDAGNVRLIEGDLRDTPAEALLEAAGDGTKRFDVVLSDMAPSTTGDRTIDHHQSVRLCHAVLDRCGDVLAPRGRAVIKVFEGEAYPELLARLRRVFDAAKGFKPKASRPMSTEMYIIALGYRGAEAEPAAEEPAPPKRRPSPGWGRA